jgi:hypothetical protein
VTRVDITRMTTESEDDSAGVLPFPGSPRKNTEFEMDLRLSVHVDESLSRAREDPAGVQAPLRAPR